ncbi:MAG: asparagine synthase (glutamine-hydrolyzing) [Bacteroidetes bacterium RIFOXYA12_FULL_35_11]|nr:MAG: asparagine synthase (glutamine-hydrolyzing) [Bacteroidetes bacterium GWF2_35_48]OFY79633.1 MAG: asparagine synthase (glutamine-hydrolyzing) [Bacteroidetes bacterium RIFOXYA12_FULL_35_11]HBX49940.1 asparagine synthase (glutamine-hydrolyzing) [Bacteroidales bacterium]
MCGIAGIYSFTESGKESFSRVKTAISALSKRGPDGNGIFIKNNVALGHARLSIIDTSNAASQPFTDISGRYTIVFNGEFYNYKFFREQLKEKGYNFKSDSDTEVLLNLYIEYGISFFEKTDGDFAFAIYDSAEQSLLIARDRMGVKPLLYYQDENKFVFASEMKAIIRMEIPLELDAASMQIYFQLNYIPQPYSIFKNVHKLNQGEYIFIKGSTVNKASYYKIPYQSNSICSDSYEHAQKKVYTYLENSVLKRLMSDVPLGAFLSGGIDSSIISALASCHVKKFNTFSIGFKDEPFFDETHYAKLVADMHKTEHTVFSLSNNDLYEILFDVLEYFDEPFADSSALAVYILSQQTRKHVTVALSGDGADELFSGYNKHAAHLKAIEGGTLNSLIKAGSPLWGLFPQSRNSKTGNIFRQLQRFSEGLNMSDKDRYWRWCSLGTDNFSKSLLKEKFIVAEYEGRKKQLISCINNSSDFNEILLADMQIVLPGDMLVKADMMTMANSLEVRVPFLDHELVNYIFSLPAHYKIDKNARKKILKDTFRGMLPEELYNRPKHGFEVPLLKWFRGDLKTMITEQLLEDNFIEAQNIFNVDAIKKLKSKLFSGNPGDVHANIWALIVFQYWWKKYVGK